jgi:hypothetical protein
MKKLSISFSGGRTSAYMAKWLLDNKSNEYDLNFVFANTGLEHEKTLDFIDRCDKEWGLNLTWLETVVNPERGKGSTYKIVDYESASRNGEPFEAVCAVYGLSNPDFQPCNREMKTVPMDKYRRDYFGRDCQIAIGIRVDEIDRMNLAAADKKIIYPLISWHPTTKAEVRHWWADQPFDLEIPEHMGNCVTCWKKSNRKLYTIAKHEPHRFDFFKRMEDEYGRTGTQYDNGEPRRWFRGYQSVDDIIARSKEPFVEFQDHMPELQFKLDFDESNGCEESCDAFS